MCAAKEYITQSLQQKQPEEKYNDLHEKYQVLINKFAETNVNLNLCKLFLEKIKDVDFSMIGAGGKLKQDITEFLETINKKP